VRAAIDIVWHNFVKADHVAAKGDVIGQRVRLSRRYALNMVNPSTRRTMKITRNT
jgi:hypothetical protein